MEWIGNRISYEDHATHFTLIISGKTEDWKFNLMFIWAFAWAICGAIIIYMLLFTEELKDQGTYFLTFLIFWGYFFYKITKSILWRKYGMEFIKMDDDILSLKRSLWGYGKAQTFLFDNIISFDLEKLDEKSFAKVFNDSFWVLGQGTVILKTNNKPVNFGAQIPKNEGEKLIKVLNKRLKKYKSVG